MSLTISFHADRFAACELVVSRRINEEFDKEDPLLLAVDITPTTDLLKMIEEKKVAYPFTPLQTKDTSYGSQIAVAIYNGIRYNLSQ